MADCSHVPDDAQRPAGPVSQCEGCERDKTRPVALRVCLTCGHVGCCDSSQVPHARQHFEQTGHPVMEAAGGAWRWCYAHNAYV